MTSEINTSDGTEEDCADAFAIAPIDLTALDRAALEAMAEAATEVLECHRALVKGGSNVVAEVLPQHGTFYQLDHCPPGDVYDRATHSQYYYHAHRDGEHGHFHTFVREAGMPEGVQPVPQSETKGMKANDGKLSHLVAISMDKRGLPKALFTTNRWVTAENWYVAPDVIAMLDRFDIDHAQPSWPTNCWVSALLRMFRPQVVALLQQRDARLDDWRRLHPGEDVFEDRRLEVLSYTEISLQDQVDAIHAALEGSPPPGPNR